LYTLHKISHFGSYILTLSLTTIASYTLVGEIKKRKAAIASRLSVVSSDGQHGNEAKVGRCCDFCETQKGEILPWPFKPRTTPLLV